jgi:hypothetical protein
MLEQEKVAPDPYATASSTQHTRWFQRSVDRWVESEGEFRQFMSRRFDAIKLIGGGNGAGLFAVAAFLNVKDPPQGWMLVGAKTCWAMFAMGVLLFCISYFNLYRFEMAVENCIFLRRRGDDWAEKEALRKLMDEAGVISDGGAKIIARSVYCFAVGCTIIFFGILFH